MKPEREVGGLTCGQVLEQLPDYLEDGLGSELRAQIEAHLRGCDVCERFGGSYAGVVTALRRELGGAEPLAAAVEQRLERHLSGALAGGKG
ncbi:MAG: zf-HC2 domain-containing protein [Myxococcales bacterium]|nr:zf-HC2 domain-containing protein [Myxococcales bacterium]